MAWLPVDTYPNVAAPEMCPSCNVSFKPEASETGNWDSPLLGHWGHNNEYHSGARMAVHEGMLVADPFSMDGEQKCWGTPSMLECEHCCWRAPPPLKE